MNISYNSVTPVHAERVYHKSLEEYFLAPIAPAAYLIGKILSSLLRSLLSSLIIVLVGFTFGATLHLSALSFFLFSLVLFINSIIFSLIGFIASMKISSYEEMALVNTFVLLPMSFMCGTFFSVATLPECLKIFVELLPLTHSCSLLRSLSLVNDFSPLSMFILTLYLVVGFFIALLSFTSSAE